MAGRGHLDGGYERRYGGMDDRDRDFGRGDYHMRADRPGAIGGPREPEWERAGPTGLLGRAGQDASSLPGGVMPRLEDRPMGPGAGANPALRGAFPGEEHGAYRREFPRSFYDDVRDPRDRDARFAGREPPLEVLREPRDLRDLGPPLRDPRDMGPLLDPRDVGPPPLDRMPSRDILHPREEVDRFTAASRMGSGSGSVLGVDMSSLTSLSGVDATLASLSTTLPTLGVMEPIVRGQCLLLPPVGPSEPSARHKPNYCKTVFVGHLPRNTSRQSLYDIFDACGRIASIRLNQRSHFAHIQFDSEDAVDKAMELNNYSIKVDLSGDLGSMGKIIVDYAVSRDDVPPDADPERAAEIEMRRLAREQRHKRERSSDSPPPSFTDTAVSDLKENFRKEMYFEESCRHLTFWLEKGLCNRHNTEKFFSLIQTAEGCLKRVMKDKRNVELEVRGFIADIQLKQDAMKRQVLSFCKMFALFEKQDKKLYDLFTRPQRKMLQQWTTDTKKLMKEKWVNLLSIAGENGMTSLEEEEDQEKKGKKEPESKRRKSESGEHKSDSDKQLKTLKDEMAKMKAQYKEKLESRDKEIAKLKEMVGKGRSSKRERPEKGGEVPPDDENGIHVKPEPKKQVTAGQVMPKTEAEEKIGLAGQVSDEMLVNNDSGKVVAVMAGDTAAGMVPIKKEEDADEEEGFLQIVEEADMADEGSHDQPVTISFESVADDKADDATREHALIAEEPVDGNLNVKEGLVKPLHKAALIGVVAAFLSVHPFGASFATVSHYLRGLRCSVSSSVLWSVLRDSSLAFSSQPGAKLDEPRDDVLWYFNGFKAIAAVF